MLPHKVSSKKRWTYRLHIYITCWSFWHPQWSPLFPACRKGQAWSSHLNAQLPPLPLEEHLPKQLVFHMPVNVINRDSYSNAPGVFTSEGCPVVRWLTARMRKAYTTAGSRPPNFRPRTSGSMLLATVSQLVAICFGLVFFASLLWTTKPVRFPEPRVSHSSSTSVRGRVYISLLIVTLGGFGYSAKKGKGVWLLFVYEWEF